MVMAGREETEVCVIIPPLDSAQIPSGGWRPEGPVDLFLGPFSLSLGGV